MQLTHFIGIDISKTRLDWSVVHQAEVLLTHRCDNDLDAIAKMIEKICTTLSIPLQQLLFTMEYTGRYNQHLVCVLEKKQAKIWQVSPLHLTRSMGIQRGKNDPVDAKRIALFAMRHVDQRRVHQPIRQPLLQVKALFALRRTQVRSVRSLKNQQSDLRFIEPQIQATFQEHATSTVAALQDQIALLEEQMLHIIHDDTRLSRLFTITTSVIGVGKIVAIKLLLSTNEFKTISDPKKIACQAGIAPFAHSSGTSLNQAPRVSNMADHELKYLLHLAALAAIRTKGELQDFYHRKKQEGKHSMSVINTVRNKIVHRVCACVKQDRMYKKNYQHPIAA